MEYIISKYTFPFISSKGNFLVYNSRMNLFLEVSEKIYNIIHNSKFRLNLQENNLGFLDEDVIKTLIDKKIIVMPMEDDDYLLNLEIECHFRKYSNQLLALTLVPTTSCNFSCPYCFENTKSSQKMSDEIINDLIFFIKEHKKSDSLNLIWYGGEPLLATDIIEKILTKITEETDIKIINHQIITNGYYFNCKVINIFKKYPLDLIQITLDGGKNRHDTKRRLRSGKGSYDQIIKNIDLIVKEMPNTLVSLRVNIDKNNVNDFFDIQKELYSKWPNVKVNIYPGFIRIDDINKKCLGCESLLHEDMRNFYFNIYEQGQTGVKFYPVSRTKNCAATLANSYIIGPEGEIYKCWNDVGDTNKIVGYIYESQYTNKTLLYRYLLGSSCFRLKECQECFFLPVCAGGCAWYRLKNIYESANYDLCSLYNDGKSLQKCLELHYETLQNNI